MTPKLSRLPRLNCSTWFWCSIGDEQTLLFSGSMQLDASILSIWCTRVFSQWRLQPGEEVQYRAADWERQRQRLRLSCMRIVLVHYERVDAINIGLARSLSLSLWIFPPYSSSSSLSTFRSPFFSTYPVLQRIILFLSFPVHNRLITPLYIIGWGAYLALEARDSYRTLEIVHNFHSILSGEYYSHEYAIVSLLNQHW